MQSPDLSRRSVISIVAIVVGVVVIVLAVLGGSGPSKKSATASGPGEVVKPVQPIDPDDKDARRPGNQDVNDVADPFAESYGASDRRRVTVRVSANGYLGIWVYYRDRKKPRLVTGPTFTQTRMVEGRLPLSAVVMQIPGTIQGVASRATCTIVIDGTEVSRESTSKPWALKSCIG